MCHADADYDEAEDKYDNKIMMVTIMMMMMMMMMKQTCQHRDISVVLFSLRLAEPQLQERGYFHDSIYVFLFFL